jgi:hypothetical protein
VSYEILFPLAPSAMVGLNRAVAKAFGPEAVLELVDALASEPSLQNYRLLPSVRGDSLMKLGRFAEACKEFERAASLTSNPTERALLIERDHVRARFLTVAVEVTPKLVEKSPAVSRGLLVIHAVGRTGITRVQCVLRLRLVGVLR